MKKFNISIFLVIVFLIGLVTVTAVAQGNMFLSQFDEDLEALSETNEDALTEINELTDNNLSYPIIEDDKEKNDNSVEKEDINDQILYEVTSLRSETEKHFKLKDGSFVVYQYSNPVHYKVGDKYKDIDNTLTLKEKDGKNITRIRVIL